MNEQELNAKFQEYEKKILEIQEQLRSVEQALSDMSTISSGLEDLKGKKDKEIMAQIGSGIYVKAKLLSEEVIVDIGGRNFVEKTIDETKGMIKEQNDKMKEVKQDLEGELENINQEITKTMQEHQSAQNN